MPAAAGVPGAADVPAAADLPAVVARLAAVTAHAQQLADALEQARAQDGGLRQAAQDLLDAHDAAQRRLDARVRAVYIATGPDRLSGLSRFTGPDPDLLGAQGGAGAVRIDRQLVDAVSSRSAAAVELQASADRYRDTLRAQATAVLAEQDEARTLLAEVQRAVAVQVAAAQVAAHQAARAAALQAQAAAAAAALDAVSASVTDALTPAQSARGRRAAEQEEPVLRLLEASGSGYPAGYAPTGAVLTGTASWYGPGFVGSPTASGRPYDPERPSCAHRTLPLGTVLHVSANGRSTNCLVDDRGPYVGDRILDMSRSSSRSLGYSGVATVTIEVLAPV